MAFRGFFALNGVEIANSSRIAAHLGTDVPTDDLSAFGGTPDPGPDFIENPPGSGLYLPGDLDDDGSGLYDPGDLAGLNGLYPVDQPGPCGVYAADGFGAIPATAVQISPGLWAPPDGARRFGPGLYEIGDECWAPAAICGSCQTTVVFDDSWDGLAAFLNDGTYRVELSPWYTTELPESGEFGGIWVMDVKGLDTTSIERPITATVGNGAVAGPHRDAASTITFDAILIACSNAGVEYGLNWLTCRLRATADNTTTKLRYLNAHPGHSAVDPASLVRERLGVVLTKAPEITEMHVTTPGQHRQADQYRVTWEMTALNPYAYLPAVNVDVDWDVIARQPINWIHAADCKKPETCEAMPVMFSTECVPEEIQVVNTPPPVCGGCLPVSAIDKYSFRVPTMDYAFRCRETAVSMVITNTGEAPLTLKAFWRVCNADVRCDDEQWPLQISGLPASAELHLDGVTGRFWAYYDERKRRPVGVVGTPNGAPWRPPVIDRETCWDFIVQTSSSAEFTVSMSLADREA